MSGFLPTAGHARLAPFLPGGGKIPLYASYGKVPLPPPLAICRGLVDNNPAPSSPLVCYRGEWRRGTSPLRSLRTRREPLGSPGSHHPAVGRAPNCQCGNSEGCLLAIPPSQKTAFVRW